MSVLDRSSRYHPIFGKDVSVTRFMMVSRLDNAGEAIRDVVERG